MLRALHPPSAPGASVLISAAASATETLAHGIIDGTESQELAVNTVTAALIGTMAAGGGPDFVKGDELLNQAVKAIAKKSYKSINKSVKKTSKKIIKKALKRIGKSYAISQFEGLAYAGLDILASFSVNQWLEGLRGE